MPTIAGSITLSSLRTVFANAMGSETAPKAQASRFPLTRPTHKWPALVVVGKARPIHAKPQIPADKVDESIKSAEESCSGGETDAECAAAWDEVEELSAEASYARAMQNEYDPLESFCKDNPETDECRSYDN